ncbi:Death domain-containing protein 1 [Sparganum proliferum]
MAESDAQPPTEAAPSTEEAAPAEGAAPTEGTAPPEGAKPEDEAPPAEEAAAEGEGAPLESEDPGGKAPAPTPAPPEEEDAGDPAEVKAVGPDQLNAMLSSATAAVQGMTPADLIKYLDSPDDIHAQAVKSAKKIAQDFVEKAADLSAAMKLILQFDQLALKKLNASTIYDFGKPKTDEETRAMLMDRAQRLLSVGQKQYEISHKISESAKPLLDLRYDACETAKTTHEKIMSALAAAKEARKAEEEELRAAEAAAAAAAAAAAEAGEGGEGEGGTDAEQSAAAPT